MGKWKDPSHHYPIKTLKPSHTPPPSEPPPAPPPHTSCDGNPPALVVVSKGHGIALLGGHHPDSAHTVLALHIGVVARVASCQLGIYLVLHTGGGEGVGHAVSAE